MLLDRHSEIMTKAGITGKPILDDEETDDTDEEQLLLPESEGGRKSFMEFVGLVEAAGHQIDEISALLSQLREILVSWYSSSSPEDEKNFINKIDDTCLWVSEAIRAVKRSVALLVHEADKSESSLDLRMRRNMHAALLTKLSDKVREFKQIQNEVASASKDRAVRQIQISIDVSEEKAKYLVENGVTQQAVYSSSMTAQTSEDLMSKLTIIREKVSALRRIQRSMEDVQQLLISLEQLVLDQSHLLDNIEADVINAKNFSAAALQKLIQADRKADRRLSAKLTCIIWLFIILFALGAFAFFYRQTLGKMIPI